MLTDQPAAAGNSRKAKALLKFQELLSRASSLRREDKESFTKWLHDVQTAIRNFFDTNSPHLSSFNRIGYSPRVYSPNGTDFQTPFRNGISSAQGLLKSIISEVQEYWPDDEEKAIAEGVNTAAKFINQLTEQLPSEKPTKKKKSRAKTKLGKSVFIVHGHDNLIKEQVASFIKKIGLKPIILHEKPNKGKTIIEKIESNHNVAFAVALWTPDDKGKKNKSRRLDGRARQNVIFETGYFIGLLGRDNVAVLRKKGTDIPSDYDGVLYLEIDKNDSWQLPLAKEMKAAGLPVDMNKIIKS